jgi:hypothetical protein
MSDDVCKRCSQPCVPSDVVRLWDGCTYCEQCVKSASEPLLAYAKSHETLEETAPFDRAAHWKRGLRMEAILFAIFVVPFAAYGIQQDGWRGLGMGVAVAGLIVALQGALQVPMFVWVGNISRPKVSVKDGSISLRRITNGSPMHILALSGVRWRFGTSKQDSGLRNTFVPRQPVIILSVRRQLGVFRITSARFACGWTPEMREIWTAFLTLAGVPAESWRKDR